MFDKDTSYKIVPLSKIEPDPDQPRKVFDPQGLEALAQSIREVGILNPITVRRFGNRYRLVAGERRYRAAAIAGLTELPCLIRSLTDEQHQLAALIENLQRHDLDPFEEAEGLQRLIAQTGMTQAQAAQKLGKSQSGIANKLRLLGLDEQIREALRAASLTERHARALLTLPEERRATAASHIISHQLNVEQTERYLRRLTAHKEQPRRKMYIKDIRLFINTIDRSVRLLTDQGIGAQAEKKEDEQFLYYSIAIPKIR